MKNFFIWTFLLAITVQASGQSQFRVYLKDKGSSQQLMIKPEAFLSPAALERRALQNIALSASDLPIAAEYRQALKEAGAEILASSKWLNYIHIQHPDSAYIAALDFVRRIEIPRIYRAQLCSTQNTDSLDYGFTRGQIEMLAGKKLHLQGYTGHGMNIALIDAGFRAYYQAAALDSLRLSGRLKGTFNFIDGDTNVFGAYGTHGSSVLSLMAANLADTMVGSAPHANYWLFTTENIYQETPLEMDH